MDLSIIILNYNSGHHLAGCIQAAKESARNLEYELIIVDNASIDDSLKHSQSILGSDASIQWLSNPQNLGFARGNNPAIQSSQGRWVVLLNPDTQVQPEALTVMIRDADARSDVGIVGGKLLYPDGTFQWACRRKIPTPRTALARLVGKASHYNYLDNPELEMEVEAISGSFMLIRRALIEQVGLLDEAFFMYGEDLDYCLRARLRGWKVHYQPRAVAIHGKGESSRRGSYKALYEYYRAMWIFYKKHYAFKQPWYMTAMVYAGVCILCAVGIGLYPFKTDKRIGSRYS